MTKFRNSSNSRKMTRALLTWGIIFIAPFTSIAQFSGGSGIINDPYIITTPAQLAQLATYVNNGNTDYNGKCYKLGNNIDISDYGNNFNNGEGWIPIGIKVSGNDNDNRPFRGAFDGDNKKISGLYINNSTTYCSGLFGYIINGTVKNLGVENVNIVNKYSASTKTGGIVGEISYGSTVSHCYSTGLVSASSYSALIGGVVGIVRDGTVSHCYSSCSVSSIATGSHCAAGGVIGIANTPVSNCYSTGSVSSTNTSSSYSSYAGGVVGVGGTIDYLGGQGIVVNCAALNPAIFCYGNFKYFGRVIGNDSDNLSNNIAFSGMLNPDGIAIWNNIGTGNFDGENISAPNILADGTLGGRFTGTDGWTIQNGMLPGFITPVTPPAYLTGGMFVISVKIIPNESAMKKGTSQTFEALVTGFDIAGTVTWNVDGGIAGTSINSSGILTISATETAEVLTVKATSTEDNTKSGSAKVYVVNTLFNGNGTKNNPFMITTPEELAYFAEIVNEGSILRRFYYKLGNNIDLSKYGENFNNGEGWIPIGTDTYPFNGIFDGDGKKITGLYINTTTSEKRLGLFRIIKDGIIKNLGVENVNISSYGAYYIGGIVGFSDAGNISHCYSTGVISATSGVSQCDVGGVVGINWGGAISNCYSTMSVSSIATNNDEFQPYSRAGGLVGNNRGTVSHCYSTGLVSSFSANNKSFAGGVVGDNQATTNNNAALNPSISCVGNTLYFGRISGTNSYKLSNNIAFINILNTEGGITWENIGTDNLDGADITIADIHADGTLGGRFTNENGWTTKNGKLPGLFGNTVDMPEHLKYLGINDLHISQVFIYPNPTNNIIFVECDNNSIIKIFDMLGKEIFTKIANGKTEINISHLPKGIYCVIVLSEGKMVGNSKIVKQ